MLLPQRLFSNSEVRVYSLLTYLTDFRSSLSSIPPYLGPSEFVRMRLYNAYFFGLSLVALTSTFGGGTFSLNSFDMITVVFVLSAAYTLSY